MGIKTGATKRNEKTNATNLQIAQETNASNERIAAATNEANYNLWKEQNAEQWKMWNAQNEYNTPQAQAARLREAGMNPYLSDVSTGSASSMSAASPIPAQGYTAIGATMQEGSNPMAEWQSILQGFGQFVDQIGNTFFNTSKNAAEFPYYKDNARVENIIRNAEMGTAIATETIAKNSVAKAIYESAFWNSMIPNADEMVKYTMSTYASDMVQRLWNSKEAEQKALIAELERKFYEGSFKWRMNKEKWSADEQYFRKENTRINVGPDDTNKALFMAIRVGIEQIPNWMQSSVLRSFIKFLDNAGISMMSDSILGSLEPPYQNYTPPMYN